MTETQGEENIVETILGLRNEPLSIIKLSEHICPSAISHRTSDVSTSASEIPSPASLEADLSHYKELFSKLRFSYLEQVTKEKFLRAIVGDPPLIVDHAENTELESQLIEIKAVLKAQKRHVANIITELDTRARNLSQRYENIGLQTTLLSSLPPLIEELDETLFTLRKHYQSAIEDENANPVMALPLPATLELLKERKANHDEVNARLKSLQQAFPDQSRTLDMEERHLRKLEIERDRAVTAAREVVEKKQECSGTDDLEIKGRWLRAAGNGLRGMLELEA